MYFEQNRRLQRISDAVDPATIFYPIHVLLLVDPSPSRSTLTFMPGPSKHDDQVLNPAATTHRHSIVESSHRALQTRGKKRSIVSSVGRT
jgi:hypothetical protein